MTFRYLASAAIILVPFLTGCSSACGPVSETRTNIVTSYIAKRYGLAENDKKNVKIGSPIGSSCVRQIIFRVGGSRKDNIIYLTGDQEFLTPFVYDLSKPAQLANHVDELTSTHLKEISPMEATALSQGAPFVGNSRAKVTIIEFSDFECPFCKKFASAVRGAVNSNHDVRLVYKFYPLPFHPWAKAAATAGYCAYQQSPELFWKLHDYFYAYQPQISSASLNNLVESFLEKQRGFDMKQYEVCRNSGATQAALDQDIKQGNEVGVSATPTSFVNGKPLLGSQDSSVLDQMIVDGEKISTQTKFRASNAQ